MKTDLTLVEASDLESRLEIIQPSVDYFMERLSRVVTLGFNMQAVSRPDIVHLDVGSWNEDTTSTMTYDDYILDKGDIAGLADSIGIPESGGFAKAALFIINKLETTSLQNPWFSQIVSFYTKYDPAMVNFLLAFMSEESLTSMLNAGPISSIIGLSPVADLRQDVLFNYGSWRLSLALPAPLVCYTIPVTYDSTAHGNTMPYGIGGLCQFIPFYLRNYVDSTCVASITALGVGKQEMTLMNRSSDQPFVMHPNFTQSEMFGADTLNSDRWGVHSYDQRELLWFASNVLKGLQILRNSHGETSHKVNSTVRPVNFRSGEPNYVGRPGDDALISTHSLGMAGDSRPNKYQTQWVKMLRNDFNGYNDKKGPIFASLMEAGIGGMGTYISSYGIFVHLDSRSPALTAISESSEATSSFFQKGEYIGAKYSCWENN